MEETHMQGSSHVQRETKLGDTSQHAIETHIANTFISSGFSFL